MPAGPDRVANAREVWEAIEGRDFDVALEYMHPDVVWVPPKEMADGRECRGRQEMRRRLEEMYEAFDEATFEVRDVKEIGESVFIEIRLSARGQGSGITVEMPFYQHVVVADPEAGATLIEDYFDRAEALRAAGLRPDD